jgi:tryptophan synthase alpha chain
LVSLVAPTSKDRIEKIAASSKGFLYCVSSLGVTGVRSNFNTDFETFFSHINSSTKVPTAIGFGISTADDIKRLKGYSDGLIVGSAFVKRIENSASPSDAIKNVGEYTAELRAAMDE